MEAGLELFAVSAGRRRLVRTVHRGGASAVALAVCLGAGGAVAQQPPAMSAATSETAPATAAVQQAPAAPAAAAAQAGSDRVALELNKLENLPNGCRAYMVVDNRSSRVYSALKLDLVMFQTDGVIGRRFAVELAPVKATKTGVKLFDLEGVRCDDIGSLLINEVMDCKSGGDDAGCLERLTVGSRAKAQLSK